MEEDEDEEIEEILENYELSRSVYSDRNGAPNNSTSHVNLSTSESQSSLRSQHYSEDFENVSEGQTQSFESADEHYSDTFEHFSELSPTSKSIAYTDVFESDISSEHDQSHLIHTPSSPVSKFVLAPQLPEGYVNSVLNRLQQRRDTGATKRHAQQQQQRKHPFANDTQFRASRSFLQSKLLNLSSTKHQTSNNNINDINNINSNNNNSDINNSNISSNNNNNSKSNISSNNKRSRYPSAWVPAPTLSGVVLPEAWYSKLRSENAMTAAEKNASFSRQEQQQQKDLYERAAKMALSRFTKEQVEHLRGMIAKEYIEKMKSTGQYWFMMDPVYLFSEIMEDIRESQVYKDVAELGRTVEDRGSLPHPFQIETTAKQCLVESKEAFEEYQRVFNSQ